MTHPALKGRCKYLLKDSHGLWVDREGKLTVNKKHAYSFPGKAAELYISENETRLGPLTPVEENFGSVIIRRSDGRYLIVSDSEAGWTWSRAAATEITPQEAERMKADFLSDVDVTLVKVEPSSAVNCGCDAAAGRTCAEHTQSVVVT